MVQLYYSVASVPRRRDLLEVTRVEPGTVYLCSWHVFKVLLATPRISGSGCAIKTFSNFDHAIDFAVVARPRRLPPLQRADVRIVLPDEVA